jgi:integrase
MLEVMYAAGLRVSELVALNWSDVLPRDEGRVQLSVTGKGGKTRQVLLPATVSQSLILLLPGGASGDDPVFVSIKTGGRLRERAVLGNSPRSILRHCHRGMRVSLCADVGRTHAPPSIFVMFRSPRLCPRASMRCSRVACLSASIRLLLSILAIEDDVPGSQALQDVLGHEAQLLVLLVWREDPSL